MFPSEGLFFVSHERHLNQIPQSYATYSLLVICSILFIFTVISIRKKNITWERVESAPIFTLESTLMLRGMAVILLIFGHFAIMCIEHVQPFEYLAEYAVIIFLFLSGVGITKKYGIKPVTSIFIVKRVQKLLFPLWFTLVLFYSLDYLLLERSHSIPKILFSFLGIINPDPPNGPDWFISYIIFLYLIFYLSSQLRIGDNSKTILLFVFSYLAMVAIESLTFLDYFKMWPKYALVFPLAVLIGQHRNTISYHLDSLRRVSLLLYLLCVVGCLVLYKINFIFSFASQWQPTFLSTNFPFFIDSFRPLYIVLFSVMLLRFIDTLKIQSRFLLTLGNYSFEIYLLHMPFMVYYDFFLFRKPLAIFFIIYCGLMLTIGIVLRKVCVIPNRLFTTKQ